MSQAVHSHAAQVGRFQMPPLVAGGAGLALCVLGSFFDPTQFFRSYLLAYVFWTGLALGCLAILMMQYLTGGAWGLILRRALESATRTLPLLVLLFVPLLFGLRRLYVWTDPAAVAADPLLAHKSGYLNVPFFAVRACLYLFVWAGLALLLNRWSRAQDRTGGPQFAWRLEHLSGPGLFLLAVTMTLALVDWVMSLEPRWYSTIYAVGFMAGEMLAALSFVVSVVILLSHTGPLAAVITRRHFRDLGNLLLTFVMLWAYCAFSQYLLIWSGNLREEIPWYLRRLTGGWGWVAVALIVCHFFLPFFLLLFRDIKEHTRTLAAVACVIILLRLVDLFWLLEPAFYPASFRLHWMDIAALVGLGGLWLATFVWQLGRWPLLPLNDPYAEEAFGDE